MSGFNFRIVQYARIHSIAQKLSFGFNFRTHVNNIYENKIHTKKPALRYKLLAMAVQNVCERNATFFNVLCYQRYP